ncbi:MAG: hypothetical protein AAGL68_00350 [Pseudomonadota bacterium]
MHMLSQNAAAAYRKVDLDARIEASGGEDLTRICLEEAVAALRQAELACGQGAGRGAIRDPLSRAHSIALWLCRGVADDNPLREALLEFYGGMAALIRRNISMPRSGDIAQIRGDFDDLLKAARAVQAA